MGNRKPTAKIYEDIVVSNDDAFVVCKIKDYELPVTGRLRVHSNNGRFTPEDFVYVHRGDGAVVGFYWRSQLEWLRPII